MLDKGVFILDNKTSKKHFHMPGGKAGKILLNLLVTAIVGFIYFYTSLPAINLQAGEFYVFVGLLCPFLHVDVLRDRPRAASQPCHGACHHIG